MPVVLGISIHALREERDQQGKNNPAPLQKFQSTRSARSATGCPRRERAGGGISIHALREERDAPRHRPLLRQAGISIHALREERDQEQITRAGAPELLFQSTRSARSATLCRPNEIILNGDFNPRAPRGARHPALDDMEIQNYISIHALREERDVLQADI